jgi:hypothetical protein
LKEETDPRPTAGKGRKKSLQRRPSR